MQIVVDVRLRPDHSSMGAYVKAKSSAKGIEALLSSAGIGYVLLVELGNIFMNYDDWPQRYRRILTEVGDMLIGELYGVASPFCLICAERDPDKCHRKLISDYLVLQGFTFLGHL